MSKSILPLYSAVITILYGVIKKVVSIDLDDCLTITQHTINFGSAINIFINMLE